MENAGKLPRRPPESKLYVVLIVEFDRRPAIVTDLELQGELVESPTKVGHDRYGVVRGTADLPGRREIGFKAVVRRAADCLVQDRCPRQIRGSDRFE